MNHWYHTRKEKKKIVENLSSLNYKHHSSQKKSLLGQFKFHYKNLDDEYRVGQNKMKWIFAYIQSTNYINLRIIFFKKNNNK
jgi:hypothetical protein